MSPFDVVCHLEGADDRWLYFSQEFVLPSGETACRILLRAMIRGPKGTVAPQEVLELTDMSLPSPSGELEMLKQLGEAQLSKIRGDAESSLQR